MARRVTYPWFLVIVTVMAGAGILILTSQKPARKNDNNNNNNLVTKATFPVVTSSVRRITKSLAELRQDAEIPELSDHVVFFNRVPKSGSEMLVLLLQWLQGTNSFRHVRLGGGNVRQLNRMQQVSCSLFFEQLSVISSDVTTPPKPNGAL
jgi:dermatan/chondrotin sulfate uronyl 2-O-sulfotransferase UST